MRAVFALSLVALMTSATLAAEKAASAKSTPDGLWMVVMDPLALPLSCPCVEGYAQRNYEKLAEYLSEKLGQPVRVTFSESLITAQEKEPKAKPFLVIGKDSVVRHDSKELKLKAKPLAQLTGKDGATTMTGLILVRSADKAKTVSDLKGYRILFGNAECDEKFAAARTLLEAEGVKLPSAEKSETFASCSDGACKVIEWGDKEQAAAVISSYAAPLLEGCGTVKKGDLRVVGETEPVPFVTAFATKHAEPELQKKLQAALLDMSGDPKLLEALETLLGFVPLEEGNLKAKPVKATPAASEQTSAPAAWPGWRGPTRDGRVAALPQELKAPPDVAWRVPLVRSGLGGIAATQDYVILGDRDLTNESDEFRCYSAANGDLLWTVSYPAPGSLDYDNAPRANPLIHGDHVFLLGAFGHLTCADLATGLVLWQINIIEEFDGEKELVWGTCSSPLIVDGKLIVNPGGEQASLVALEPDTGFPVWQTPGDRHAYGSFIVAKLGGKRQLVGHDRISLGGWDIETGERLWTLVPPRKNDFNVPTPVEVNGRLLVMTENNRTRLYEFDNEGRIVANPVAQYDKLAPDMSSPVIVGNRVFCVCEKMYCLDLANGLAEIWTAEDPAFCDYAPLLAGDDRVLVLGRGGELLLIDATCDEFRIVSRQHLFEDGPAREAELYVHPALVGSRLYVRGEKELVCVDLSEIDSQLEASLNLP